MLPLCFSLGPEDSVLSPSTQEDIGKEMPGALSKTDSRVSDQR